MQSLQSTVSYCLVSYIIVFKLTVAVALQSKQNFELYCNIVG